MKPLSGSTSVTLLVLLLLASWACDPAADRAGPTGPTPEAPVGETSRATHAPGASTIRLRNLDLVPRNYLLFEAELAAVVDPNLDPDGSADWIVLDPGEAADVRLEAIPGWRSGATAVYVYTWRRSVSYQVGDGVQWLGEGWEAIRVEL